jgi:hypothetical protein
VLNAQVRECRCLLRRSAKHEELATVFPRIVFEIVQWAREKDGVDATASSAASDKVVELHDAEGGDVVLRTRTQALRAVAQEAAREAADGDETAAATTTAHDETPETGGADAQRTFHGPLQKAIAELVETVEHMAERQRKRQEADEESVDKAGRAFDRQRFREVARRLAFQYLVHRKRLEHDGRDGKALKKQVNLLKEAARDIRGQNTDDAGAPANVEECQRTPRDSVLYRDGEEVFYHDVESGEWVEATVVQIHRDDTESAYYDVSIEGSGAATRQTVHSKLKRRPATTSAAEAGAAA